MVAASRNVDAKRGPDVHGSVHVDCPWCDQEHVFNWNQIKDDRYMIREAGCLKSGGGVLVIGLQRDPPRPADQPKPGGQPNVPLIQPSRKRTAYRPRKAS